MKFGAEPKKLAVLGALFLVLMYALYTNVIAPSDDVPAGARRTSAARPSAAKDRLAAAQADALLTQTAPVARPRSRQRAGSGLTAVEYRIGSRDRQQPSDPMQADPTLRLDLLVQLHEVKLEGGARNLFQFGAAPLPKTPEPKIVPAAKPGVTGPAADAPPPGPPPPPPPPPIPLKFYGYTSQVASASPKRAFFLDGDDIIVAVEGEMIKKRYKVVRIGINSVVVEDTQFKHEQTLPLEEGPMPGQQG